MHRKRVLQYASILLSSFISHEVHILSGKCQISGDIIAPEMYTCRHRSCEDLCPVTAVKGFTVGLLASLRYYLSSTKPISLTNAETEDLKLVVSLCYAADITFHVSRHSSPLSTRQASL